MKGSPTVVFDSSWGDWAPVWTIVQPEVAKWTRACSYDRAGTGFSDPGPMPRTSLRIAAELRSVLPQGPPGPSGSARSCAQDFFFRGLPEAMWSPGLRPIRVPSTGKHGVHSLDPAPPPDSEQQKYQQAVAREQASWLALSSNAKQLFSDKSSEYIPLDQPSFVVDAVHEVYTQSK